MVGAILKATKEVFFSILGVIGFVTTVAGAAKQFGFLPNVPIHSWVLWLAAIAALFVSAVKLQIKLDATKATSSIPAPDMTLLEVVQQIVGSKELFEQAGLPEKTLHALLAIREAALQWRLSVFGRKNVSTSHLELYPRAKIAQDYWHHAQIEYLAFMNDPKCPTDIGDEMLRPPLAKYSDLHFNRREVDQIWPKHRKRWFTLRSPITFNRYF